MRICENGKYRDATEEEMAQRTEIVETPITETERIEALEAAVLELAGVILNG